LLHAYSLTTDNSQLHENKQKLQIAYLTSLHNSIFSYKLRTDQEQLTLKILKKLRTASLNSEFTCSKKSV